MSVSTSTPDAVQAVIDVLDGYTGWTNTSPDVYHQHDVSQQDKQSKPDPAIYVWSPTDGDLSQFSGDNDSLVDIRTVECSIWTLDATDTHEYHEDTIDFLQSYAGDNYSNLDFHHIRPNSVTDSRSENVARMTDHYIMSIQVELQELRNK
jgi:hypothetical protein